MDNFADLQYRNCLIFRTIKLAWVLFRNPFPHSWQISHHTSLTMQRRYLDNAFCTISDLVIDGDDKKLLRIIRQYDDRWAISIWPVYLQPDCRNTFEFLWFTAHWRLLNLISHKLWSARACTGHALAHGMHMQCHFYNSFPWISKSSKDNEKEWSGLVAIPKTLN